jgi:4-methyl-5(b-hydroxyethyl)-thiazole monophosphate biosynthesis
VEGSRGLIFVPDVALDAAQGPWDQVVLPGGMKNAETLATSPAILALLRSRMAAHLPVAAICAAPLALDAAGVLSPGQYTCYPGIQQRLSTPGRRQDPVVEAGYITTSQGPATAMKFAIHLLGALAGEQVRDRVAQALLFHG